MMCRKYYSTVFTLASREKCQCHSTVNWSDNKIEPKTFVFRESNFYRKPQIIMANIDAGVSTDEEPLKKIFDDAMKLYNQIDSGTEPTNSDAVQVSGVRFYL